MKIQLGSDRDPAGSVFLDGERIVRGIRSEFKEYYTSLLSLERVQKMLGSKIIDTQVIDEGFAEYALTLEHRHIFPPSYAYEWPLQMLQDAAALTLEICLELNDCGAVLKDATPWNVLFDGPRPLMVDFTSIMPQEENLPWVAYDQFCRTFLFPLLVGNHVSGRTSRALLLNSQSGISSDEVGKYLPGTAWMRYPWLINRLYLPLMTIKMIRYTGQEKEAVRYAGNVQLSPQARRTFFENLQRDLSSLQLAVGQSFWSQYYDDINQFFKPENYQQKQRKVAELLARCKPQTVVDLGCNMGGYSILAAREGAKVTAMDTDEESVAMLYRLAKEKDLQILPLVGDVLYPTPQCGWRGIEFPSAPERFRSDMALALALTHHLAITQCQTFDRVAQTLSDYTRKWLITEFVPPEDRHAQELLLTNRRKMGWYTLDSFKNALGKYFKEIETYPSHPEGRILCFCKK